MYWCLLEVFVCPDSNICQILLLQQRVEVSESRFTAQDMFLLTKMTFLRPVETGWPLNELSRLQVKSCLSGHNFVNISLHFSYMPGWFGSSSPCYRLPGPCLKRAYFFRIKRRNGPTACSGPAARTVSHLEPRLWTAQFLSFVETKEPENIYSLLESYTKNDGKWLSLAGLAQGCLAIESLI